jgi:hypothetical protein
MSVIVCREKKLRIKKSINNTVGTTRTNNICRGESCCVATKKRYVVIYVKSLKDWLVQISPSFHFFVNQLSLVLLLAVMTPMFLTFSLLLSCFPCMYTCIHHHPLGGILYVPPITIIITKQR